MHDCMYVSMFYICAPDTSFEHGHARIYAYMHVCVYMYVRICSSIREEWLIVVSSMVMHACMRTCTCKFHVLCA